MTTAQVRAILEALADENPDAVLFDGLEDALVGMARRQYQGPWAVYDRGLLLELLELQLGTAEDAIEWLTVNVEGLWAGDNTPLIVDRCDDVLSLELVEHVDDTEPVL